MTPATLAKTAVPLLLALGLASCGPPPVIVRTEPTKFLQSTGTDMTQRIQRLPFEHSWRDPKVDITKYKNIIVRPVTTSYLKTEKWEESKSTAIPNKRGYTRQTRELARYWTRSLNKSFSSPVCMFYRTSDTGAANTLILEVALTEVRFGQPVPGAVTTAPLPTGIVSAVATGLPVCAFEARVRDASTGRLVSTAADRRGPDIAVMDDGKNDLAKPNQKICDEWSEQLMKSSNLELFPQVRRKWFSWF